MNNREACIVHNMLSGIGYAKYKALVTEFEEPSRVFSAVKSDLTRIKGISDTIADKILNYKELVDLDNELLRAERGGVQILTLADEEYPDFKDISFINKCANVCMRTYSASLGTMFVQPREEQ